MTMLDAVHQSKQRPIQDCEDHSACHQSLAMMDRPTPQHSNYPQSSLLDVGSLNLSPVEDHLVCWILLEHLGLEDLRAQAQAHDTMQVLTKVSHLLRDGNEKAMVGVPGPFSPC